MIELWFYKLKSKGKCSRCSQNTIVHKIVNNKNKEVNVCDNCLVYYPLAGKRAPIKFTKEEKKKQ